METPKSKKNIRPEMPRIARSVLAWRPTGGRHEEERKYRRRYWRVQSWQGTWHTKPASSFAVQAGRGDIECVPRAHWGRARVRESSRSAARISAMSASLSAGVVTVVHLYY